MQKARNIKNLESLEREIYRLQGKTRKMEDKLGDNFDYLQDNFSSLFMNSFFRGRSKDKGKENGESSSFFKNKAGYFFEEVSDHIAGKVANAVNNLVDRMFHKEK
jgi:hypothetical protein